MLTTISEYIKLVLDSEFPQTNLLDAGQFVDYLRKREILITKDDLEYYDKREIIRPVLRLYKPLSRQGPLKYSMIDTSIFGLKQYYTMGLVKFPVSGDFQPWSNYFDKIEEKVLQFYHPFQFVAIRLLTMGNNIILKPSNLESFDVDNCQNTVERLKQLSSKLVDGSYNRSKEIIPKIGLLILLDEAYGPYVKSMKIENDLSDLDKWSRWRTDEFSLQSNLEKTGMTVNDVKELYDYLCISGYSIDPLKNWFMLLQLMKLSSIRKLYGKALLAQDYYSLAYMLHFFIYDLTKEKIPDPDDINDNTRGEWKKEIYSNPFDYDSRKTRNIILDSYLSSRSFRLILVLEGKTEEIVVNLILEALAINPDRDGFIIHNLEGQPNMKINLGTIYYLANKDFIDVFTILDNDQEAEEIIRKYNINKERYHKWNKDFEYDNFGLCAITDYVNSMLKQKGLNQISKDEVEKEITTTDNVLTTIINNLISKENRKKFKLSKVSMCQDLVADRIKEITSARESGNNWKPQLPIEHVLKKIFEIFPEISFAV
jgi:hypothetical protein